MALVFIAPSVLVIFGLLVYPLLRSALESTLLAASG